MVGQYAHALQEKPSTVRNCCLPWGVWCVLHLGLRTTRSLDCFVLYHFLAAPCIYLFSLAVPLWSGAWRHAKLIHGEEAHLIVKMAQRQQWQTEEVDFLVL